MATNNRGHVPEEERCNGISRQSKERCKRRRSPGSEYCIFHGGRAPKGGAHNRQQLDRGVLVRRSHRLTQALRYEPPSRRQDLSCSAVKAPHQLHYASWRSNDQGTAATSNDSSKSGRNVAKGRECNPWLLN